VLTDFGAEKGFGAAAEQLWEHYGFRLHRDSVRGVVKQQAQRAEDVVGARHRAAVIGYRNGYRNRQGPCSGEEVLIAESDGSFVRTGKLELAPGVGVKRGEDSEEGPFETETTDPVEGGALERGGTPRQGRAAGAVMGPPAKSLP